LELSLNNENTLEQSIVATFEGEEADAAVLAHIARALAVTQQQE
jgi:hypothetical protein